MALNPDPYYRDPEIEKLNLAEEGSLAAIDRFNAAPPGHSLTDTPGNHKWERPAIYTNIEEAMEYVVTRIEKSDVEENFLRLMLSGAPIESITNTITFTGFLEGYWSPDLAEMLKTPVALHLAGLAIENDIPATIFNIDPEVKKQKKQMPDETVMQLMEQNRPDMYNKIMYAADVLLEEPDEIPEELSEVRGMMEEPEPEQPAEQGFMDGELV